MKNDAPIHMDQVSGVEGGPQTVFSDALEQKSRRPGVLAGDTEQHQARVIERGRDDYRHRHDQEVVLPSHQGKAQQDGEDDTG